MEGQVRYQEEILISATLLLRVVYIPLHAFPASQS
jgi:hypothetical protein